MIKHLTKTLLASALALLLFNAPAWATLYDTNNFLSPTTKSHLESAITTASKLDLDLTITVTSSDLLDGFGSTLANTDIENYTQSVLAKETKQHHEGFAFTVVTDRKGKNGFAPAIRYAANENFILNQNKVEDLINDTYRQGYWEDTLPVFLDKLTEAVEIQQHKDSIIGFILLGLFIVLMLVCIFLPSSGKYSSGGDSYFYSDGGSSGGGFSGGD